MMKKILKLWKKPKYSHNIAARTDYIGSVIFFYANSSNLWFLWFLMIQHLNENTSKT